jgi:hypothetical protein
VVQDMEFIGFSSKKFTGRNEEDMRKNTFCTMPIKFRFEDRNARIHFETAMRNHCTLKASISLPKPIREEQSAFLKALRSKYAGQIVTVRPDTANMALQGFIKPEGQKWERLPDRVALDYGILLPGYKVRSSSGSPGSGAGAGWCGRLCRPGTHAVLRERKEKVSSHPIPPKRKIIYNRPTNRNWY